MDRRRARSACAPESALRPYYAADDVQPSEGVAMPHTHFSVIAAAQAFLGVVIIGTLWRLVALHFIASGNSGVQHAGKAMLFQY